MLHACVALPPDIKIFGWHWTKRWYLKPYPIQAMVCIVGCGYRGGILGGNKIVEFLA
jgi:hypothetical protein